MKLYSSIEKNLKELKQHLVSDDITFLDLTIGDKKASLIFINDLVNKDMLGELILRPLSNVQKNLDDKELFDVFLSPEKEQLFDFDSLYSDLLNGNAILLYDGSKACLSFGLKHFEK